MNLRSGPPEKAARPYVPLFRGRWSVQVAFREKLAPNDTGPLDAAILKLKSAIFRHFADTRRDDWNLAELVAGVNRRPQESYLHGGRPVGGHILE